VNEVDGDVFGVNIIPHTAAVTTFSTLQPGGRVNIEIDTLARYVARLVAADPGAVPLATPPLAAPAGARTAG
jgi:riboflavin synthase